MFALVYISNDACVFVVYCRILLETLQHLNLNIQYIYIRIYNGNGNNNTTTTTTTTKRRNKNKHNIIRYIFEFLISKYESKQKIEIKKNSK